MNELSKPVCTDECLAACPLLTQPGPDGSRQPRAGLEPSQMQQVLDLARRGAHVPYAACGGKPVEMGSMYVDGPPLARCDMHPDAVAGVESILTGVGEGVLSVNSLARVIGQSEV